MQYSTILALAVAAFSIPITLAEEKYVIAHVIAGNCANMANGDWQEHISLAKQAGLDGFIMDIAPNDGNTDAVLANAYQAAETAGNFTMSMSFDYLSDGVWPVDSVINNINKYKDSSAQFNYEGRPFASTFEGVNNVEDWAAIKGATGAFLIPSWTSLGPQGAASHLDIADGLFAWSAWPDGPKDMTTETDEAYMQALGGKPYMMAVSPSFYTNMPNYGKNWVWNNDLLWADRWDQAVALQPAIVEVLTWNDFGESHYIGPVVSSGIPDGASRYVENMPHDAWRETLPYYISAYKSGNSSTLTPESDFITYAYKLTPASSGSDDGTTGNTASQGQQTYPAAEVSPDTVQATVVATQAGEFSIQIGSNTPSSQQIASAGIHHVSVPMNKQTGPVTFTFTQNGQTLATATGPEIMSSAPEGLLNFNLYVGSSKDGASNSTAAS